MPKIVTLVVSVIALAVYRRIDEKGVVVPVALGMYALGIGLFALCGRKQATEVEQVRPTAPPVPPGTPRSRWLHRGAINALVVALGVLGAVTVAAFGGPDLFGSPSDGAALAVLGVIVLAITGVAAVELRQTRGGTDEPE